MRTLVACALVFFSLCASAPAKENLVPEKPGFTPSYWCTWGIQNYSRADLDEMVHAQMADNLTEELLFNKPGWLTHYFDKARADLYVLYDLGWDVPRGTQFDKTRWMLGWFEVPAEKFPSCTGTPAERLRKLNLMTKAAGWHGAALWLPAQAPGDGKDGKLLPFDQVEAYWRQRARWTREAGIEYWKVDYGACGGSPEFREMIARVARDEAPGLMVEHARGTGPVNDYETTWDDWIVHRSGRFRQWNDGKVLAESVNLVRFSNVFRTYDVTAWFSAPTTLDRVGEILSAFEDPQAKAAGKAAQRASGLGLLNCEDEPYIAATLGAIFGALRHPLWLPRKGRDYDPRHFANRADEVVRAARWQRLAPAYPAGTGTLTRSAEVLMDAWVPRAGDMWASWLEGKEVKQGAAAVTARNMPLPKVSAAGERPFVVAGRNPKGPLAVATLPRLSREKRIHDALADVTIEAGDGTQPVGVFGHYRSLTINFSRAVAGSRVLAQDLAGTEAADITSRVQRVGTNGIRLPCELIEQIGRSAASPGDVSDPGLVLVLR